MIHVDATVRKWGNSFGVTIPKEVAEKESLKEKQQVRILILRDSKALKQSFGSAAKVLKESAQQLKNNLRKELYDG